MPGIAISKTEVRQEFPYVQETQELSPREYLRLFPEFEALDRVAQCESKWQNVPNYLYDGESGRFTAYGPFQIVKSTAIRYSDEDRKDPYANVRIAITLFHNEGFQPWSESSDCWQ